MHDVRCTMCNGQWAMCAYVIKRMKNIQQTIKCIWIGFVSRAVAMYRWRPRRCWWWRDQNQNENSIEHFECDFSVDLCTYIVKPRSIRVFKIFSFVYMNEVECGVRVQAIGFVECWARCTRIAYLMQNDAFVDKLFYFLLLSWFIGVNINVTWHTI